jgi:tRNA (guanine-N7-)-methyltransferase
VTVRRGVRLSLEQLAPWLLTAPDPPGPLSFPVIFGNAHPVEIEVGSGKGLFLVTASAARPDVNFLGIEIERKYQLFTATRLAKRGRSNVRMVCADARIFIRDCIPPGSVQAIHVYFPDPWWKRRHRKRRLWTPEFAEQCERGLRPGGRLNVATDVQDYFAVMTSLLEAQPRLRPLAGPAVEEPGQELEYLTNFERKSHQVGTAVNWASFERIAV